MNVLKVIMIVQKTVVVSILMVHTAVNAPMIPASTETMLTAVTVSGICCWCIWVFCGVCYLPVHKREDY